MKKSLIVARISLKAIAEQCKVAPKAARVLLRKSDLRKHDDNWSFVEAEAARVRTLLNPKLFPAKPTVKAARKPRVAKAKATGPTTLELAPVE